MGHFTNDGIDFIIPLIGAIFATVREVTPFTVTVMFLLYYGTGAVFSAFVGRLADKTRNPNSLIGMGTMLMSLGLLGYFVTLSYTTGIVRVSLMLLSSLLTGFGSGFFHPLVASVLRFSFDGNRRGRVLGINGAIGGIGRTMFPSLFFFLAVFFTTYGSIAFLGIIGALVSAIILAGLGTGLTKVESMSSKPLHSKVEIKEALTRGIICLTILALVSSIAGGGIASWIPIYISKQKGFGLSRTLGLALTVMAAGSIVGQPIFGWLQERFDPRLILGLSFAGTCLSVLGYLTMSEITALAAFGLFGFFTYAAFPLLFSLSAVYVDEKSSSLGNAIVWGLGLSGGNVIGPLIVGAFLTTGYGELGLAFELMAAILLISAFGTILLPKSGSSF